MEKTYSSWLPRWTRRPLAALGLLLATAGAAQAQAVAFAPVAAYTSGGMNPYGLAVGDVNGDGRPDLVTINSVSYMVAVLPGSTTSPGTFGGPATYASGGNTGNALSVALGDVNGDGRLDVVATNTDNGTVSVLLNLATAPGTFGPATVYSTGNSTGPRVVALGDVNGDGRLDIATASFNAGSLSILLNSASTPGTFGAPVIYSTGGSGTSGVALGDLNGDGRLDAVTLDYNTRNVAVFLNQAAAPGTFGTPAAYGNGVGSSSPFGLTLGDVNGDGRLDVATANLLSPTVSVLLNSAATPGTLLAATTYSSGGTNPIEVAINDLNGDGQADLAVSNYGSNTVGVLLNSATAPGTFAAAVTFSTGAGTVPRALV
ncbi:MAG: VCBS repeat-containing protein, partial [Hymenobacter sp.]